MDGEMTAKFAAAFILILLSPFGAMAKPSGYLQVHLGEVRPTQGVIGKDWAEEKCKKFEALSKGELKEYLEEETPPAVMGPKGTVYLLDNHHEFYCLQKLGVKTAWVKIIGDLSEAKSSAELEQMLRERNWIYLGDENGKMTMTLAKMPKTLADLGNDPYRGLASRVRKAGGFEKVKRPHVEFIWANMLRQVIPLDIVLNNPELALQLGLVFAKSAEASRMPGYSGTYKPSDCERFLSPGA